MPAVDSRYRAVSSTSLKRPLRFEEDKNSQSVALTEEQIQYLEKADPCFWERKMEILYSGNLLSQDTFLTETLKGIDQIYMQAVVDTSGSLLPGDLPR